MRINIAAPTSVDALALLCATPATDLRTYSVRTDVRSAAVQQAAIWAKRVRVTAPTTGMGHVDAFGAGTVPGSSTWSPPI
ncbi:hypothetical protein [Nocardioides silvaticus]|nr:hypothetical protein [Nocardioides silvaticus]